MRIVIDAGHGGSTRAGNSSAFGARGPSGTLEKDVTLDIARQVAARLGGGAAVTRSDDRNLSLAARAARASRDGADVFVSIHANSGPPDMSGPETWVHPDAGASSHALAAGIQRALDRLGGRYGGGAASRLGPLAVLNPAVLGSRTTACLVEVDYLSNPRGEQRLRDPSERAAIGAAIATAIQEHVSQRAVALDWDLSTAIAHILPVIERAPELVGEQRPRLRRLMTQLRDNASADDRYLNGYDSLLTTLGPRLNQEQFNIMIGNSVRADLLRQSHWTTDADVVSSLDLLDRRILQGIAYLNRRWATDGAALAAALLQLKDWIAGQQHNRNSIYWNYGEGQ